MLLRPVAMWADEYKIVADRIHEILSKAPGTALQTAIRRPGG